MPVTTAGKLNSLAPKAENGLKRGLILVGKLVAQRATNKAPRLTGRLKRSIAESAPYAVGPGAWGVNVGTNVEYAAAHEFGSGIHSERGPRQKIKIVPRNAQVLAFEWTGMLGKLGPNVTVVKRKRRSSKLGKYEFLSFYKGVMHPGVKPHPYLRPALNESRPDVHRLILKSVAAALKSQ